MSKRTRKLRKLQQQQKAREQFAQRPVADAIGTLASPDKWLSAAITNGALPPPVNEPPKVIDAVEVQVRPNKPPKVLPKVKRGVQPRIYWTGSVSASDPTRKTEWGKVKDALYRSLEAQGKLPLSPDTSIYQLGKELYKAQHVLPADRHRTSTVRGNALLPNPTQVVALIHYCNLRFRTRDVLQAGRTRLRQQRDAQAEREIEHVSVEDVIASMTVEDAISTPATNAPGANATIAAAINLIEDELETLDARRDVLLRRKTMLEEMMSE